MWGSQEPEPLGPALPLSLWTPRGESFPPAGLTRPHLLAEEGGWTMRGTQNDSRCFQDTKQIMLNHLVRKSPSLQVLATSSSHSPQGPRLRAALDDPP